jgi:3-oxoacyl-[acyl-carrier-protein] synthase III
MDNDPDRDQGAQNIKRAGSRVLLILGQMPSKKLLEKTNTDPSEIDLLICATVTPDHPFPATAILFPIRQA